MGCHSVFSCGGTCGCLSEVVSPVVVLEREKAMTCRESSPSVNPRLEAANAAVTAAFSAPQEVKFTSIVNSPVRLATSDESGKAACHSRCSGDSKCRHQNQTWNGAPRCETT